MFVLFAVFMTAAGGVSITTAEFTSLERCEEAKYNINAQIAPQTFIPHSLVCTPK